MPPATPVATPLVPTVATAPLELDHVPPVIELESAIAEPAHTVLPPLIADGIGLTVTVLTAKQPDGIV
jgi:hypothetical protein